MHKIHNQPIDGPFGKELQEAISNEYSELIIVSAFAKSTGVLAIKDKMIEFRKNGGKITAYIGTDLNGTSEEALRLLNELTDHLNICKDSRPGVIFHPKVYVLENKERAWVAIGSNNLTNSGLYRNIECATIMTLDLTLKEDKSILESIHHALDEYQKSGNFCIEADELFIEELLKNGYISKEIDIIKRNGESQKSSGTVKKMFGQLSTPTQKSEDKPAKGNTPERKKTKLTSASKFWIQTGKMTGGSGNQLDLSKTGKIVMGDARGTPYALEDGFMMGSVSFFGVNPDHTAISKDITISLNGLDYVGNTIKIETEGKKPNQSWRIQLKGISPRTGESIHQQADLVDKILLFEEINDGYYLLTILDSKEEAAIKNASRVVAANGSRASNRKYGVLYDDPEDASE